MNIRDIKELLTSHYDYISKIDAIRFVKKYDSRVGLSIICKAYNEIEKYNY